MYLYHRRIVSKSGILFHKRTILVINYHPHKSVYHLIYHMKLFILKFVVCPTLAHKCRAHKMKEFKVILIVYDHILSLNIRSTYIYMSILCITIIIFMKIVISSILLFNWKFILVFASEMISTILNRNMWYELSYYITIYSV